MNHEISSKFKKCVIDLQFVYICIISLSKLEEEKFRIKRDRKDLINQVSFGNSIKKLSEFKQEIDDKSAALFDVLPGQGGKTRKHKKPLKKKTATRNKNKTKKVKKGKKTIKRRKVAKKKHQKTR